MGRLGGGEEEETVGLTGGEGKKKQASAIAGRYLMGTSVISWNWQADVSRHIDSLPAQSSSLARHSQLMAPGKP